MPYPIPEGGDLRERQGSGMNGMGHGHHPSEAGTVRPHLASNGEEEIIQAGWMLKKGRKKLQGYARRHFTLTSAGVLTYRLAPSQPARGERSMRSISIAASGKRREITIDGGERTGAAEDQIWHLKCVTGEQWTMWMSAMRTFISDAEVRSVRSIRRGGPAVHAKPLSPQFHVIHPSSSFGMIAEQMHVNGIGMNGMNMNGEASAGGESKEARFSHAIEEMGKTINEMSLILSAAQSPPIAPELPRKASYGLGQLRGKKEMEKERREGGGKDKEGHGERDREGSHGKEKEGFFGIFHRRPSQPNVTPSSSMDIPQLSKRDSARSSPSSSVSTSLYAITPPTSPFLLGLSASLTTLRDQHAHLLALMSDFPHSPPASPHSPSDPLDLYFSSSSSNANAGHRRSMATVASLATDEVWYDADDADGWDAEEIALDEEEVNLEEESGDEEEEEVEEALVVESDEDSGTLTPVQEEPRALEPERRVRLPATTSGEEVSLWAVLRKNVGKDLSTIAFPVSFNEPLSLLQKLAEELEYADLLAKAVAARDPVERMCLVSAFAVSTYASTHYRGARKPFNPMLGETFEDIRPLSRFVAEKVQHHPPVMASYAEGEGWTYWATSGGKNKFWGRSLEIIPVGTTHLKIGSDHYQWAKPSSFMRNLMAGAKYIEHVGTMTIENVGTRLRCDLDFKEAGFWGSTRNAVSGIVRSSDGEECAALEGTWHESFSRRVDDSGDTLSVLWRAAPMPAYAEQYYGFTAFAMQLNEVLPEMVGLLPPTDSRLRPDQRALEEGRVEEAEEEKVRLEMAQRERRKRREEAGETWCPRWFRRVQGRTDEWEYGGGYWEARQRRQWEDPGLW